MNDYQRNGAAHPNGRPKLLDHNGRPFDESRLDKDGRPDGSPMIGGIALPHSYTFIARSGGAYNTYWHERYDEALRHSREDAKVMKRDAYLMALLQERKLAVASLNWHLEVPDPRDPFQMRIKDRITRLIRSIPLLDRIIGWMLEAIWYGRYGVQVEWDWTSVQDRGKDGRPDGRNRRGLTISQAWPVNGDKIGFQYDHTPYIQVSSEMEGKLPHADIISTTNGRAMTLRGTWRDRFLLHRHIMEDADYFDPDQGGAVHGVGVRSVLFWTNWLKLEWLSSITDFFDRIGLGFTMWKYPAGNPQAKAQAEEAARSQSSRSHLLVPVWGEGGKEALTGVERVEVPTAGTESLRSLIEYLDGHIERYVVGQSASASSGSSGIGNEAATEFQVDTKSRITLYDAKNLAVSLSGSKIDPGLVNFIQKHSAPEADFPIRWVFDVENPQSESKLNSVRTLVDFGLEIKADEVRAAAGYSKPSEGDELIKPPAPPGGMPGGMPGMEGGAPPGMPGMDGGDPSGMPPPDGAVPPDGAPQEGEEAEGGDFLEALRMRRGEPERYGAAPSGAWRDMGIVRMSPTGLPLHRWYDPQTRQSRIQSVPPGQGRRGKRGTASTRWMAGPKPARLALPSGMQARLEQALQLMFDGWVNASSLPKLIGAPDGSTVTADVARGEDRSLDILASDGEASWKLTLRPDGDLALVAASASPDKVGRAARAAIVAGVDGLETEQEEFDLTDPPDEAISDPKVLEANDERRNRRLTQIDEILAEADGQFPPEHAKPGAELKGAAIPVGKSGGSEVASPVEQNRRLGRAVQYLRERGRMEEADHLIRVADSMMGVS